MAENRSTVGSALPEDWQSGLFAGRLATPEGPVAFALREGRAHDLSPEFGTVSAWLNSADPLAAIGRAPRLELDLPAALAEGRLLAPVDLQAVKASGVTYVRSMLERVIEERCRGDAARATAVREELRAALGTADFSTIRPGSPEAARVQEALTAKGWWSQYLEVGIGKLAEIFTKCQPLAAVGPNADVGILAESRWNNPEPEAVLVIAADGRVLGATLGNDVNLRDIEGRSALLLGRAKDNNASCAMGPLVRLFDAEFTLDSIRQAEITLRITGEDGFSLEETGAVGSISRDPADLAEQLLGREHQYPDGAVLFLGTPFSPSKDRGAPGMGFTHQPGDVVRISSPRLGTLGNTVRHCADCPPWREGAGALLLSLVRRGYPHVARA